MDSFIIMMLWFLFILIMLDIIQDKLFNKNKGIANKEARLQLIKNGKNRTIKEQIEYIKIMDDLYISFPKILVIIMGGVIIFSFILSLIVNFIIGIILALLWSSLYSLIIIRIEETKNDIYYYMLFFLYILFITVSMCINLYYKSNINFWILLGSYILLFITHGRVKKWLSL